MSYNLYAAIYTFELSNLKEFINSETCSRDKIKETVIVKVLIKVN